MRGRRARLSIASCRSTTATPTCFCSDWATGSRRSGRERRFATAPHVDGEEEQQPDHEVAAGRENGEPMVAGEDPRHHAVGEGAKDGGRLGGEAPQAEELREARRRCEVANERTPRRLGRPHAQTG